MLGKPLEQELESLWKEFIRNPQLYEYFETELMKPSNIRIEKEKYGGGGWGRLNCLVTALCL